MRARIQEGVQLHATILAQTAYGGPAIPTRTPRATEYEVFARVSRRLGTAIAAGTGGFATLAAALQDNRRLWTVLAADLVEPGNGLPDALKARLLYLAAFTEAHTHKVLSGKAGAEVLIDINTAVMRGLRGADAGRPEQRP
jgi:flagellar protein FlaF